MESIVQKDRYCPEGNEEKKEEVFNQTPGIMDFFEALESYVRKMVRIIVSKAVDEEFRQFIGVSPYERSVDRSDYRNGFRYRSFETKFRVLENLPIPRGRKGGFFPSLFNRWQRREKRIIKIRTTNIIERAFREFRRMTKAMHFFPTEESSCIRIMFALPKLLNEDSKHNPIKDF